VEFFREPERRHAHFSYRPCLSEQLVRGDRVGHGRRARRLQHLQGLSAYLCGPPAMVEAGVKAMKRRRMAPRRIFREELLDASSAPPR
jgi:NAD(P)H-flavin reductase